MMVSRFGQPVSSRPNKKDETVWRRKVGGGEERESRAAYERAMTAGKTLKTRSERVNKEDSGKE